MRYQPLIGVLAAAATLVIASPSRASKPADAWITTKVKVSLLSASDVNGTQIHVDTYHGHVTLQGRVASHDEADRAITLAKGIEGVTDVQSLLRVSNTPLRTRQRPRDGRLADEVRAALRSDRHL